MHFDVTTIDSKGASGNGSVLTLLHPVTGKVLRIGPKETDDTVRITCLGAKSAVAEDIQRKAQRRRLKKGFQYKLTPEELETEALNLLVALTQSWENIGDASGPLECTPDNVRQIYVDRPWIREQVDEFVADLGNFLGN